LTDSIRKALRNGWNTELLLAMPLDNQLLIQPANHWAPVQAYYAVQAVSLAWFRANEQVPPSTHQGQLDLIAELWKSGRAIPYPMNMVCTNFTGRPRARVEVLRQTR